MTDKIVERHLEDSERRVGEAAATTITSSSSFTSSGTYPGYPKSVSELARKSQVYGREKLVHSFKQSELYSWLTFTVGIFYGIPAVQLVLHHNYSLTESGDQDLCYYNFLCTVPSFNLTNFNNILSNSYYLICGCLFMILTWNRQRQYYNFLDQMAERPSPEDSELSSMQLAQEASQYGIPQHYGLFYGMGIALIMEGFFSSFYHVCPSPENFQFDTTFMYLMAVLSFLKVYQFRHADITANAYKTLLGIGILIFFEALGIFYGETVYWVIVLTLYFLLTVFLIGILYHPGEWTFRSRLLTQLGISASSRMKRKRTPCQLSIPKHHGILIGILIALNLGMLIYGAVAQSGISSYILNVFLGNLMAYVAYYVGMKIYFKEKFTVSVYIYTALTMGCLVVALYYYTRGITDSTLSPAESRNGNRECIVFDIYDSHDIWHMFSAMGLFFCFMLLHNLDDGLFFTPRTEIKVF